MKAPYCTGMPVYHSGICQLRTAAGFICNALTLLSDVLVICRFFWVAGYHQMDGLCISGALKFKFFFFFFCYPSCIMPIDGIFNVALLFLLFIFNVIFAFWITFVWLKKKKKEKKSCQARPYFPGHHFSSLVSPFLSFFSPFLLFAVDENYSSHFFFSHKNN